MFYSLRKSLTEFRRRSGEKILIVFDRDMCVGENTPRPANVLFVCCNQTKSALQQDAAYSKKWHSHFFEGLKKQAAKRQPVLVQMIVL